MSHILIIHDDDQDGYCAAAIAKKHYEGATIDAATVNDEIDWDNCAADTYVFLDHTPSESRVKALLGQGKTVFIVDHHEETEQLFKDMPNVALTWSSAYSTAKLAWITFYPDVTKIPFTVEMINKWDSWNHDEDNILPFHYGMECMNLEDDSLWESLLFKPSADAEMQLVAMGNAVGQFWLSSMNALTYDNSWVAEKDGIKYTVCNSNLTSSYDVMTHIQDNECQGAVWFWFDGSAWQVAIKVLPDENRRASSTKQTLTYEQLTESWFYKNNEVNK